MIIISLWQYPHCGTWPSIQACWTGCRVMAASAAGRFFCCAQSAGSPSSVVTSSLTAVQVVMQERASRPPTSTAHAPH